MTENDIFKAASSFSTRQYGPLYIVSGEHARGKTFHAYLLDPGQTLSPNPRSGSNNRHPDLTDRQAIYGIVRGQPGWTEEYGWMQQHPGVQDGSAIKLLTQLVEANIQSKNLGITNHNDRQAWLAAWATQHLGAPTFEVDLPTLDSSAN